MPFDGVVGARVAEQPSALVERAEGQVELASRASLSPFACTALASLAFRPDTDALDWWLT